MRELGVIRTVWLAVLCLIGIGAMAAIKAGSPPPLPSMGASPGETTIANDSSRDTLIDADKLESSYVRAPLVEEAVMQVPKATVEHPPRPLAQRLPQKL